MNPAAIIEDSEAEALVFASPVRTVSIKFHKGCQHGRKDKARK